MNTSFLQKQIGTIFVINYSGSIEKDFPRPTIP